MEPEDGGESGGGEDTGTPDVLTGRAGRPAVRAGTAAGHAPWRWALGGFAAACALAVAAVQVTGYGRADAPDLHGYRVVPGLCAPDHLQPLVDAMAGASTEAYPLATRRGTAVDHTGCLMTGSVSYGDGWSTVYLVSVTVDLHKKHDPRAEFEDEVRDAADLPAPGARLLPVPLPGDTTTVTACPGLGDRAFLTAARTRQTLSVLHGGAVLTVGVQASNAYDSPGNAPLTSDGTHRVPGLVDTSRLRPALAPTARLLMAALSR
jgi:hypothetical protein